MPQMHLRARDSAHKNALTICCSVLRVPSESSPTRKYAKYSPFQSYVRVRGDTPEPATLSIDSVQICGFNPF